MKIFFRLLLKFYFCCELLCRSGTRILTYAKYAPVLRSVCSLHCTTKSEFAKKSTLVIFICSCVVSSIASADFGKTCAMPSEKYVPRATETYLTEKTIYGYVRSLLDISNCGSEYSRGCDVLDPGALTLCVKKTSDNSITATSDNSDLVTINVASEVTLGSITSNLNIQTDPTLANIKLLVYTIDNKICLVMPTTYGYIPLMCRNAKVPEPMVQSDMSACSTVSTACNLYSANNPSKTANNFFGSAVQCVYESLNIVFFDPRTCDKSNIATIDGLTNRQPAVKPFAKFYSSLQFVVSVAITLYVIFFGIKMMLDPTSVTIYDGFIAALKIILVIYFSVGSAMFDWFSGKVLNQNGITQIVLPFMISFADTMSSYIFNNSSANNLCYFDIKDYPAAHSYYSLWDSLDCRLNTYLGNAHLFWQDLTHFSNVGIPGEAPSHLPQALSSDINARPSSLASLNDVTESTAAIGFFAVIGALLLAGGIFPFALLVFVMMIIVGLMFSIVMSYIVSIILMYILAYIAPIFVPMALFEKTKGYFDSWLNLCMSTALQPVIITAFGAFALTLIDSFMFDQCGFAKYSYYDAAGSLKYIFQLRILDSDHSGTCASSIGYKLFQYFQSSEGWQTKTFMFFKITSLNDIWDIEGSLWTGAVICFFMRYLLDQIYNISEDISGGMNVGSVATKPMAIINTAIEAGKAMTQEKDKLAAKIAADAMEGGDKKAGAEGKSRGGASSGGDKVSGGGSGGKAAGGMKK